MYISLKNRFQKKQKFDTKLHKTYRIFFLLYSCIVMTFSACDKQKLPSESVDNLPEKMREFIYNISFHAKAQNPNFLIIPQNGIELAYRNLNLQEGIHQEYRNAIDGIGIEALYYDGEPISTYDRHTMLAEFSSAKTVLVSDYVNDNSNIEEVIHKNTQEGFLCFPRSENNYDYTNIPDFIVNENNKDIENLKDAQNYLYLINAENYQTKVDYINAIRNTNFDVVLIDLFFHESALNLEDITTLKIKKNGAKRLVISYVNIGAAEKYRYYFDKDNWNVANPHWLVKPYNGYPEEIFVKYWAEEWQQIIYENTDSYLNKIIAAGFDGAYLDNVKSYEYLFSDAY